MTSNQAEPAPREMPRRFFAGAVLLLACIAAALSLYATREGIGLSPDADTYLAMARQLAAGEGLRGAGDRSESQPAAHYPPLYPLILAALSRFAVGMTSAARVLNAATFAGVVIIASIIFRRLRLRRSVALLGVAMFALSCDLLYIHSMLLSDGVFLFLLLLALLLLDARRTIAAAVVIALATLSRYAGGALVLAAIATLLLRRRYRDAGIVTLVSSLPISLWILRNRQYTGSAVNRELAFHPPGAEHWQRAADTIAQWLWPTPRDWMITAGVVTLIVLGAIAALSARNARREGRPGAGDLPLLMLIFAASYALFVLVSITFLDANIRLDFRILAPLQIAIIIPIFAELARSRLPGRFARAWPSAMAGVFILFLAGQATRAVVFAREAPEQYVGYSMLKWRDSETLDFVRKLPPDTLIYTNATALLRIQTGRAVKQVPALIDPRTLKPVPELDRRLRAMQRDLASRHGYVIYVDQVRRPMLISPAQLQQDLKLRMIRRTTDGEVLQLRPRNRD